MLVYGNILSTSLTDSELTPKANNAQHTSELVSIVLVVSELRYRAGLDSGSVREALTGPPRPVQNRTP